MYIEHPYSDGFMIQCKHIYEHIFCLSVQLDISTELNRLSSAACATSTAMARENGHDTTVESGDNATLVRTEKPNPSNEG